jgi:S-adenosylmethionine:tRNA ribosyltransferase-isomerase
MNHPKNLKISDFTYDLPDSKIAKFPLEKREQSKLLLFNQKKEITTSNFSNIVDFIDPNSLLVFNNSKVIQSRLLFKKPNGDGTIEVFILTPCAQYGNMEAAMNTKKTINCICLVGGVKKWKTGKLLKEEIVNNNPIQITAELIEKTTENTIVSFQWNGDINFATVLEIFGNTPIPPYLNRTSNATDKTRYQTVFAKNNGSVAAPTAALHFTTNILHNLSQKNIAHTYITLHVGAGTFKPVKSEVIAHHEMHAEYITITTTLIEQLIANTAIIPVGTTSMRTIESIYWMGVKAYWNTTIPLSALPITQWEVYDIWLQKAVPKNEALEALLQLMQNLKIESFETTTQIMIAPGYSPKIATSLITNFHQPQSTLLLLIAALVGNHWKHIYQYALNNDFRFLSYGDSSYLKW